MTQTHDNNVEAALWMLAQLSPQTQAKVRRRLALRLNPPTLPTAERQRELMLLADLLRSAATPPGWPYPYVSRSIYDEQQLPESPSSTALGERYGSWVTVCRHAHHINTGTPNRLPKHRRRTNLAGRRYSRADVLAALLECARDLARTPSSCAYSRWQPAAERRRRGSMTYPSEHAISRMFAERGGWIAALEEAGLLEPPSMTVRVIAADKKQAVALVATFRANGLLAAHAGNRNWVEVQAEISEVKRATRLSHNKAVVIAVWDPARKKLERVASSGEREPVEFGSD